MRPAPDPPWVLDHAPYVPFMEPRTARPPGLMPLDPCAWLTRDPDRAAQIAYRRRLLAEVPEVVLGCLPEGEAPAAELATVVLAAAGEEVPVGLDPLQQIGAAVAEDFCLLLPDAASGEYRLVAGVLCFPSHWLLSEKLGRPLTRIHDPVPGYAAALSARVNRVFGALSVGRPLWRANWLVHDSPELHQPLAEADKLAENGAGAEAIGGALYLRTERQTLVRLPETGAVVFSIKTSITPLECLTADQAEAMARELRALDDAMIRYRSGKGVVARALRLIDQQWGWRAAQSSGK